MKKLFLILLLILGSSILLSINIHKKNNSLRLQLQETTELCEFYELHASKLIKDSTQLSLTILQLEHSKDSIIQNLNSLRKELNIKDKELQELHYIKSQTQLRDTLIITDSIFVQNVKIDTLVSDEWYKLQLHLETPNIITTDIEVNSELYLITHEETKYVNEPKKCKLLRFFQKKDKITTVEVIERNPNIKQSENRFIKIKK